MKGLTSVRVALVSIHPSPSPQAVPLANAFLKSFAAHTLQEIELVDFFASQEESSACADRLAGMRPEAVGFSIYLWNRGVCREIAAELRRRMPGIVLFAGGPEVTADPAGMLRDSAFDCVIQGEGETAFAALCERLAAGKGPSGIPGIIMQGAEISTVPAPLSELDSIPSPYLTGILECSRYTGILWQLSRGCGFSCDFCFDSRDRHGVRRFPLERIEAELRHFAACNVSQVFVLDSTFNQDLKRAKAILRLIRKIAPDTHFHFEVRSEFIDRELAQLFAQIACSLQIGLQSSDSRVLKEVGRTFRPKDFIDRVGLLNESGAIFGFDLMYGLPGDTLQGFRASLDFALGLYPNHLDIFPLAVLPGTALARRAATLGLRHLPSPPYTLLSSPTFSPGDMAKAELLATACDIFYTRGKAVAWFNAVIATLGLKPSAFLERFGEWLARQKVKPVKENDLDDHEVWQLQRDFLSLIFGGKDLKRLLPLVLDLADYHYHYAAAIMTPPEHAVAPGPNAVMIMETPLRRAASARLIEFHFEILDILEAGEPDIRRLCDSLSPCGSHAVIYPGPEGVCTESLAEPYFRLLERLDGCTSATRIAADIGIPLEEAHELLAFALSEGIVLPV